MNTNQTNQLFAIILVTGSIGVAILFLIILKIKQHVKAQNKKKKQLHDSQRRHQAVADQIYDRNRKFSNILNWSKQ